MIPPRRRDAPATAAGFVAAGATDTGRRRQDNQDRLLVSAHLLAVADGVGSGEAGGEAATTAIKTLAEEFTEPLPTESAERWATERFAQADAVIRRDAAEQHWRGSASTLTALALAQATSGPRRAVLCHIGDSRCYLWRNGALHQLSADHTAPISHPVTGRSVDALARCLGGGVGGSRPDVTVIELQPGDRLLLCSDGLTKELGNEEIADGLQEVAGAQDVCNTLIGKALAGGGRDNVTVVVADIDETLR